MAVLEGPFPKRGEKMRILRLATSLNIFLVASLSAGNAGYDKKAQEAYRNLLGAINAHSAKMKPVEDTFAAMKAKLDALTAAVSVRPEVAILRYTASTMAESKPGSLVERAAGILAAEAFDIQKQYRKLSEDDQKKLLALIEESAEISSLLTLPAEVQEGAQRFHDLEEIQKAISGLPADEIRVYLETLDLIVSYPLRVEYMNSEQLASKIRQLQKIVSDKAWSSYAAAGTLGTLRAALEAASFEASDEAFLKELEDLKRSRNDEAIARDQKILSSYITLNNQFNLASRGLAFHQSEVRSTEKHLNALREQMNNLRAQEGPAKKAAETYHVRPSER
jgi:hypothetical protein